MNGDPSLHIAQIVSCTEAEGPGRRFAIWFQGCPLRCPDCCNPEMLPFSGGETMSVSTILQEIEQAEREFGIEGITLLGGEPLAQAKAASKLARETRKLELSVMIFSGFTLEEARRRCDPDIENLLAETDLLVDGPYMRELPEAQRRWIGSSNQRVHFLSDRYREGDECWQEPNTLEIRLNGEEVLINGFPAREATELWKPRQLRGGR